MPVTSAHFSHSDSSISFFLSFFLLPERRTESNIIISLCLVRVLILATSLPALGCCSCQVSIVFSCKMSQFLFLFYLFLAFLQLWISMKRSTTTTTTSNTTTIRAETRRMLFLATQFPPVFFRFHKWRIPFFCSISTYKIASSLFNLFCLSCISSRRWRKPSGQQHWPLSLSLCLCLYNQQQEQWMRIYLWTFSYF